MFIISTDFSHYPAYEDAKTVDHLTASAVLSNSPETLLRTLDQNASRGIPNLATSMCGWSCVLTLLDMTRNNSHLRLDSVEYRNSGDAAIGGKDQVVGYWAMTVSTTGGMGSLSVPLGGKPVPEPFEPQQKKEFTLTSNEKGQLLKIARDAVS